MSEPAEAADGPVTWETVRRMALTLPEAVEGTSYGTPAFHVRKKLFCRLREDGESVVLKVGIFERRYLLDAEPDACYITDHYRDWPAVLVRLSAVRPQRLRELLEDSWRMMAPKRLADAYDPRSRT